MKLNTNILCFNNCCLMRTREQNTEYIRLYRFNKRFNRYKDSGEKICHYCGGEAETMHHINENHSDNSKENLLPLCHKCHLEITHICDKPNFYQKREAMSYTTQKTHRNRVFNASDAVTPKKTIASMLENCNTSRVYNITLLKPNTSKRIHITEGSKRLVSLFQGLGFTELVSY